MPHLTGPDFVSFQARDLNEARKFYVEILGLEAIANGPPGAIVFATKPIPFAVRAALSDFEASNELGKGVSIWFECDDADALHDRLVAHGIPIVSPLRDGPFGRQFAFRDPSGYTITSHTVS